MMILLSSTQPHKPLVDTHTKIMSGTFSFIASRQTVQQDQGDSDIPAAYRKDANSLSPLGRSGLRQAELLEKIASRNKSQPRNGFLKSLQDKFLGKMSESDSEEFGPLTPEQHIGEIRSAPSWTAPLSQADLIKTSLNKKQNGRNSFNRSTGETGNENVPSSTSSGSQKPGWRKLAWRLPRNQLEDEPPEHSSTDVDGAPQFLTLEESMADSNSRD